MKTKFYVGVALGVTVMMFVSIMALGFMQDITSANSAGTAQIIADTKTQSLTTTKPQTPPATTTVVLPTPSANQQTTTPQVSPPPANPTPPAAPPAQVAPPAPVTMPPVQMPVRVTRAS